ncbi:hypothetical protein RJD24_11235 [Bacillaceae bacterium IKA-2]|nr:hypothetical protein RJD24_11235 [Bacillaceae bacterium IKA-2]
MRLQENSIYEIGLLMEDVLEKEKIESIGQNVYEISLLLHENKKNSLEKK